MSEKILLQLVFSELSGTVYIARLVRRKDHYFATWKQEIDPDQVLQVASKIKANNRRKKEAAKS